MPTNKQKVSQTMEIKITLTETEYTALATASHEAGFADVQSFIFAQTMQRVSEILAER